MQGNHKIKGTIFFLLYMIPFVLFAGIDPEDPLAGRIFYLSQSYGKLDSRSHVVYLEKLNKKTILCRLFKDGTEKAIPLELLRPTGLTDPPDLEDINESMVFHYALGADGLSEFLILKNLSNSLGNSYRLDQIRKFHLELVEYNTIVLRLCKELKNIEIQTLKEKEKDFEPFNDKKDELTDMASNAPPLKRIAEAANNGDLFLATAMYLRFRYIYTRVKKICRQRSMSKDKNSPNDIEIGWQEVFDIFEQKSAEGEKELISLFTKKNRTPSVRQKEYMQIFPKMRGTWSAATPVLFYELVKTFFKAHKDYQKRQDYSYLANFKEWGDCSLTMMMFVRGCEGAKNLEKNFDTGLKRMKKKAAARKKYGL